MRNEKSLKRDKMKQSGGRIGAREIEFNFELIFKSNRLDGDDQGSAETS